MFHSLHFPPDELTRETLDHDLAADFLELCAFFSEGESVPVGRLLDEQENVDFDYGTAAHEAHQMERLEFDAVSGNVEDTNMIDGEYGFAESGSDRETQVVYETVARIRSRVDALQEAYPFHLSADGAALKYKNHDLSCGQATYIVCLILSNLKSMSSILFQSGLHPDEESGEDMKIRRLFQFLGTAALGGEINGDSWSFGFPRLDGSDFHKRLAEIWGKIDDGTLKASEGVSESPKDGGVDVIAARLHRDGLPGFILAMAQIATGADWKRKKIRGPVLDGFLESWFGKPPRSRIMCYHIIPLALSDAQFKIQCVEAGSLLHRLRVPYRVEEAKRLHDAKTISVEGIEQLDAVIEWVKEYSQRGSRKS